MKHCLVNVTFLVVSYVSRDRFCALDLPYAFGVLLYSNVYFTVLDMSDARKDLLDALPVNDILPISMLDGNSLDLS